MKFLVVAFCCLGFALAIPPPDLFRDCGPYGKPKYVCRKVLCDAPCVCEADYEDCEGKCVKIGTCNSVCGPFGFPEYECVQAPCDAPCICNKGYENCNSRCVEQGTCNGGCGPYGAPEYECVQSPCDAPCICIKGYENCKGRCVKSGTCQSKCPAGQLFDGKKCLPISIEFKK